MLSSLLRNLPMFEGWLEETINPDFFLTESRSQLCTKFISWELLLIHENSGTEVDARWGNHLHSESSFTILSWNLHEQPIIQHFSNLQAKNNDKLWTKRSRREMLDKIIEKWVINDYLSLHCRQSWVIQYWQTFFWTLILLKSWNMKNLS